MSTPWKNLVNFSSAISLAFISAMVLEGLGAVTGMDNLRLVTKLQDLWCGTGSQTPKVSLVPPPQGPGLQPIPYTW